MKTFWGERSKLMTLPCNVDVSKEHKFSLEWRKNDKLILSAFGQEPGHIAPAMQGRIARGKGLDLTVHSVEPADEGLYHCVVTRFNRQPTKSEHGTVLKLVVNSPPKIVSPKVNHIVYSIEGSSLDVECIGEGAPPPEITWTRNDQIISTSSILHIDSLSKSDKGTYTCLAINVEGKATTSIDVKFSRPASFDIAPVNKTVVEGSNLLWHCHASSLPERIQYNWYFDKKNIKTTAVGLRANIRDGDLTLTNIQKSDRGWYKCEATDARGQTSSSSAHLDVLYPPEPSPSHPMLTTIGVGRNATLNCEVDANPHPTLFTWSKNGHFAAASSSDSYTIAIAKDSDGGIYGCQAENDIGKSAAIETHVVIAEPPVFAVKPPSEIRIREGFPLEVDCDGFGDPLPIVYWIHNQKRISSATLSFQAVSHEDYGLYECVVSNSVETVSSKMNLIVEDTKPQPATIESVMCRGEDTFEISWNAGFDSSKTQTFVVHIAEKTSGDTRTIMTSETEAIVDDLEPFGFYRITVESKNIKGAINSSIVERQSCSTLEPPSKVSIDYSNHLHWSRANGAKTYRIEAKEAEATEYRVLGETSDSHFRIATGGILPIYRPSEFRVRSMRPYYSPSAPSHFVRIPNESETYNNTAAWAICGGIITFLAFLMLYLFCRYSKTCKSPKKIRKSQSPSTMPNRDYVCQPSPQPITEIYYEPSLKLINDFHADCAHGHGNPWEQRPAEKEDSLGTLRAMTHCNKKIAPLVDYDFETGEESASAVDDMLRNKYIYEAEDVPAQLFTDLRIERLKREFKQSQL